MRESLGFQIDHILPGSNVTKLSSIDIVAVRGTDSVDGGDKVRK